MTVKVIRKAKVVCPKCQHEFIVRHVKKHLGHKVIDALRKEMDQVMAQMRDLFDPNKPWWRG